CGNLLPPLAQSEIGEGTTPSGPGEDSRPAAGRRRGAGVRCCGRWRRRRMESALARLPGHQGHANRSAPRSFVRKGSRRATSPDRVRDGVPQRSGESRSFRGATLASRGAARGRETAGGTSEDRNKAVPDGLDGLVAVEGILQTGGGRIATVRACELASS